MEVKGWIFFPVVGYEALKGRWAFILQIIKVKRVNKIVAATFLRFRTESFIFLLCDSHKNVCYAYDMEMTV